MDISAPPPSDILGPSGRALQRYLRIQNRLGPHAGLVALSSLPAGAVLLFFFAVSVSVCGEGCGFLSALFLVPLLYGCLATFVAATSFVLARRATRRLRRDVTLTTSHRVQSIKDWFVRGDITEREYDELRAKLVPLTDGTASYIQAQDASAFYRRAAIILEITILPALGFFTISFLALTDGETVALPFAFVSLFGALGNGLGIYYALRHGRALDAASLRLGAAHMRELDEHEAELLRTANRRKSGASSAAPQPYRRATYQAFSGR